MVPRAQANAQRETHLRRVIELDPNHAEARHALGYSQVNGKWATRDEVMTQRGYRKYKGKWMLPQEIDVLENKRNVRSRPAGVVSEAEALARLAGQRPRAAKARENIRSHRPIPCAVKALAMGCATKRTRTARLLFIDALAKIDDQPRPWPWPSPRCPIRWKRCG